MTDKEFRAEQRRRRIRNYLPHLPGDILKILAMVNRELFTGLGGKAFLPLAEPVLQLLLT